MLSVLRVTASNYPVGIFWPLCCQSFELRLLIIPLVSFGHCVVSPSSSYGFWLSLWYLLAIVLSVLRVRASNYPFGIFWPLCCQSFFELRFLIIPLVSFGHCVVSPSTSYGFWLSLWYLLAIVLSVLRVTAFNYPFGIFWPLCCQSFELRLLIIPFGIFWPLCCHSFELRLLIIPLVSFGHCVVSPSSSYGFWLSLWYLLAIVLSVLFRVTVSDYPVGIFWPLCCQSFFELRLLIIPLVSFGHCVVSPSSSYCFWLSLWYLLAIVLSVLLRVTASDYPVGIFWPLCCQSFFELRLLIIPLVSFGHCVVSPSSSYCFWLPLWYLLAIVLSVLRVTASDYPFGIFWSLCCQSFFELRLLIIPLVSFDKGGVDPFSPKYRLSSIICDVASFRLFKPVRSEPLHDNNRKFLHIPFANKGIDAINISNILNRKEVVKEIPPYFKNQSVPIVSYSYTNSIGRKIFNYKEALQDINIEEYLKNPLTCDCSHSPFQYNPSGHVITGDLNIIQHESLRKLISHGPKFREPQHINWKHNFKIIMDAVEDYARRWIKREVDQDPELESLSDWVRTIRSLVQGRIHKLKNCVNSRPKSVFKDQEAVKCLSSLHDKYVIVPADKASNNIVFVCKSYYFECLIKELGINSNTSSNTTYKPTSFDKDEILANHRSFMTSLNIPSGKKSEDLPYLYWIPKLHKTPYKERYIAGSSTCSTKELSIHLTKILSAVKEGQQKYCETVYSRSGINHMWILKNSKDLLDNLKSRSFSQVSSIKTFDFSTLYTTLPHDKLKTRLKETIHKAFSHRNYGSKFVVLGYNSTYFSNKIHKGKTCYSEEQVISMLEFLIDNIFVSFGGTLFQQVVGIPMGTNCAPLLADLFLYSYESEFLQKLVKDKTIHEARAFNFTYRYIDDVLSINNSRFAEFLPLIYPPELEVKETTDTASSASFLDLYLEFDDSGQLSTKIYDKRDDFNFKIINFPNMCSNIPASPAYGVYISQLIRYARGSSNYSDFLKRHLHLRNRLLDQGYKKIRLIRSLKKFIFRYQYLVEIYSVSAEKIISDAFSYSENV